MIAFPAHREGLPLLSFFSLFVFGGHPEPPFLVVFCCIWGRHSRTCFFLSFFWFSLVRSSATCSGAVVLLLFCLFVLHSLCFFFVVVFLFCCFFSACVLFCCSLENSRNGPGKIPKTSKQKNIKLQKKQQHTAR